MGDINDTSLRLVRPGTKPPKRSFWRDPLPPHLRGIFLKGLAAYFWPIAVGGMVCVALIVGLAVEIRTPFAFMMVLVAAGGFVISLNVARRDYARSRYQPGGRRTR